MLMSSLDVTAQCVCVTGHLAVCLRMIPENIQMALISAGVGVSVELNGVALAVVSIHQTTVT